MSYAQDPSDTPSPVPAEYLIIDVLEQAPAPVDILLLGPWTNLARALEMEPDIANKIGTVYVSGGNWDRRAVKVSYYPYYSKTSGSSWNIFSDPLAVSRVLQFDLDFVFMSSEAQSYLTLNLTNIAQYASMYNISPWLVNLVTQLAPCSNQSLSAIDYWDNSAAILMLQMATNTTPTICTFWENDYAIVVLEDGGLFGRTLNASNGAPSLICRTGDQPSTESEFWTAIGSSGVQCPPQDTISYKNRPTVYNLQAQGSDLQQQLSALQQQLADMNATLQAVQAQQAMKKRNNLGVTHFYGVGLLFVTLVMLFKFY